MAHAIQSLTDLDSRATVLSTDGISAFDFISRVEGGDSVLPFVPQLYSEPSLYLCSDDCGVTRCPPGRGRW